MPAVTTPEGVCNLALGVVGHRQFLDSLNESSVEAEVCSRFYASTRNDLLAAWPWRFATKRAVLALTAESRSGWGYAYAAPADMLVARRIWDRRRNPGAGEAIPFAKELNDAASGHLILTDQAEAELLYTVELAVVALWPPHFVAAVAARLAVALAGALAVKPQIIPMLERGATLALQRAAAIDANEGQRDVEADSEWIRERG